MTARNTSPGPRQNRAKVDYSTVTELPGLRTHSRQLSALYTRYYFARQYCREKDVLEVGCGAGIALGYLALLARRVVGGDIEPECRRIARQTYPQNPKIEVCALDAHRLPFARGSFDTVLLFEAIYYLSDPQRFLAEARRVLRPGGTLIVVTVNREWCGFNPSPFSVRYFSVGELAAAMRRAGFQTQIRLAFPDHPDSIKRKLVGAIRRAAVALRLIPRTMRGKEWLKRLFFGRLGSVPRQLADGAAPLEPLHDPPPGDGAITNFEVIYAVGKLSSPPAAVPQAEQRHFCS